MEVNYLGLVHTLHFALPALKKTGGLIVSIGSIQGKIAVPAHSGYVASKHALEGFCDTLRYELEETGVDILTVHPHWIQGTQMRANACTADGAAMGESNKRSHNHESITLEQCAREIIDAMRERRRELIIPPRLRLAPILKALWPALLRRKVLRIFRGQGK
jgi:short-subunit dehydrogenase